MISDKDTVLDHIAIAVGDLQKSQAIFEDLGLKFFPQKEIVESEGVTTLFAPVDKRGHLELLCPYGESGPIHQFLEKKGPGIHHLCFRVPDIEKKSAELRKKGYKLIYESSKTGARGMMVNFVHPQSTGGVLIEIVQHPEKH